MSILRGSNSNKRYQNEEVYKSSNPYIDMTLSNDKKRRLEDIRADLEAHILDAFDGKIMWFQEGRTIVKGIVNIETNQWGVLVNFESDMIEPFNVSGRWDVIIAHNNYLGAQYCGWSLEFECPFY